MIAIVNYHTGNIRSVTNALQRIGATNYVYTSDPHLLEQASHVILPGVGEASSAMQHLHELGLDIYIPTLTQPVLGICIGTQLMCQHSEEGDTPGMGIFATDVCRFIPTKVSAFDGTVQSLKIPHMGWDQIAQLQSPLFQDIPEEQYVYYVHSFYPRLCAHTIATTHYGLPFSAALCRDNFYGTQFHPEKSGRIGRQILQNFLNL